MVFSFETASVFAAGPGLGGGRNYVDADNNGICDYADSGCVYVDADGDGICDTCGMAGAEYCVNYVDADGDGVCDNYASGQGLCNGTGRGCGNGNGCGNGFRGGSGR